MLDRFYQTYHAQHFGGGKRSSAEEIRVDAESCDGEADPRLLFLKKEIRFKQGAGYRVLDFGCGTGTFLYRAKMMGALVEGVEIDSSAVAICRQLGLDSVVCGGVAALKNLQGKFDLVVLNDVLEHPLNPRELISSVCDLLNEDGKILIWTPNGDAIETDDKKITLRVDLEHMQYLTSGAVAELCRNNNLSVWHYAQIGHPSDTNFIRSEVPRSVKAKLKGVLGSLLRRVHLITLAKAVLVRFGRRSVIYSDDGNYHLFCVLKRNV